MLLPWAAIVTCDVITSRLLSDLCTKSHCKFHLCVVCVFLRFEEFSAGFSLRIFIPYFDRENAEHCVMALWLCFSSALSKGVGFAQGQAFKGVLRFSFLVFLSFKMSFSFPFLSLSKNKWEYCHLGVCKTIPCAERKRRGAWAFGNHGCQSETRMLWGKGLDGPLT